MANVIINSILIVAIIIAIIKLRKTHKICEGISHTLSETNFALATINEVVSELKHDTATLQADYTKLYSEICTAINTYFTVAGNHMNYDWNMLRNILAGLHPLIEEVKLQATEREDYRKAQNCIILMSNIEELLKKTQNNDQNNQKS